jgi:hypothetical protein
MAQQKTKTSTTGTTGKTTSRQIDSQKPCKMTKGASTEVFAPGMTVGAVRKMYRHYNVEGLRAIVGDQEVSDNHVMEPGQKVEFMGTLGDKG